MNQARTVRLPVHMVRELNQILRAKYHLEAQHHDGKDASAEDIAPTRVSSARAMLSYIEDKAAEWLGTGAGAGIITLVAQAQAALGA